jgi:protein TonB
MSADGMGQTADLTTSGSTRWAGAANTRERNFWIALACAVAFHAAFFIGVIRGKPTHLGDPTGSDQAISVSLVTEADFKSRSTVEQPPDAPPAPPPSPAQPPQPDVPKPPEPEAQLPPQPDTPQPPQPEAEKPPETQEAKQEEPKVDENAPDLFSLQDQDPAKMKSEIKPKTSSNPNKADSSKPQPKKQQKRMSELDLSTPPSMMQQPSFNGGRSAAFQRPPGITRSGLNDAFARAVIRALQQTMPQLTDMLGQVTVKILLSESGNVVDVRLLAGGKNQVLSQDVLFAARQTSYPIPPAGSNLADRTFVVTYIYD